MSFVSYSKLPDSELISMLKTADQLAYNEIFRRYFSLIFIHAQKKLRDDEVAKDVTQEVFINLWSKGIVGEIESSLAGYLYASARNRIFNLFAHEQVKGKYLESLGDYLDTHTEVPADYRIREQQMQAYIERQVLELPPKMRRVFELSRNGHLSHREIADELGVTQDNVSKQVTNALRILRTKLGMLIFLLSILISYVAAVLVCPCGIPAFYSKVTQVFAIYKIWVR